MPTPVSAFLREAFGGDPTALRTVQVIARMSAEEAAAFCQVSPETYRRWLADRPANPTALRLMALRAGLVPWPGWEDFFYCPADAKLYHADLRYGFTPADVTNLHWLRDEIAELRLENQRLRLAIERAQASPSALPGRPTIEAESKSKSKANPTPGRPTADVVRLPVPEASADPVGLPPPSDGSLQSEAACRRMAHRRGWFYRRQRA